MKSFKDTLDETATWKVKVQGLPGMYMNGKSAGEVKNKLRKLLKNPGDVISDIQRVMPTDVKKDYRLRLTGKRDLEGDDMPIQEKSKGLYYNINKKRKEGRPMRKKGEKGAPTAADFERAAQTAKEEITNESMLGHSDAEKLGKSKDDKFSSAASHIDYHHRQSGGHNKSGGDQDRHRYQVAKKLGYNVEGHSPDLDPDAQKKKNISTSDKKTLGKIADMMKKEKDKNKPTTSESKIKTKGEYDNEGEMAKQQLRIVIDAAEQLMSMLEDDENMPEWVQSKITKAVDYLDIARDYIKSDEKEVAQQEKYLGFANHVMQKQLNEGTDLFDKDGIMINRYSASRGKLGVQITMTGPGQRGRYIQMTEPQLKTLASALPKIQRDFKKDLVKEETVVEANMAQIHKDIKKVMDKTKIGYDLVMRGKKHFVKVNHNDEEDAHKAIKNHPLYVSGNLRVMPVK